MLVSSVQIFALDLLFNSETKLRDSIARDFVGLAKVTNEVSVGKISTISRAERENEQEQTRVRRERIIYPGKIVDRVPWTIRHPRRRLTLRHPSFLRALGGRESLESIFQFRETLR